MYKVTVNHRKEKIHFVIENQGMTGGVVLENVTQISQIFNQDFRWLESQGKY